MSQLFTCPSCGAALDYESGDDLTVRCDYCGSSVIVPEVLRDPGVAKGKPKQKVKTEVPFHHAPDTELSRRDDQQALAVQRVMELLRDGNKVEAVRLYRETFDCSLTEARMAIQQMEAGSYVLGQKPAVPVPDSAVKRPLQPKPVKKPPQSIGCATPAFFIFLTAGLPFLFAIFGIVQERTRFFSYWGHNLNPFSLVKTSLVFGEAGSGPGLFQDVEEVTADGDGYMYVTNGYDSRIQRFDPDGNYVSFWVIDAETEVDSLAATQNGLVYVLQNSKIYQYEGATGELVRLLEYGGPDGYFREVVTTADEGVIAMMDFFITDGWVQYDKNGRLVQVVKNALDSSDESLNDIAVDGIGQVYALIETNTRQGWMTMVAVFEANGELITRFGSEGEEEGQFSTPGTLAVDNQQRVYVSDTAGMLVFEGNGRYLHTLSNLGYTNDMEINTQNQLYFVESYYNKVIRYDLK